MTPTIVATPEDLRVDIPLAIPPAPKLPRCAPVVAVPLSAASPLSARTALSRVYGRTTQGFTAGMSLAALDVDRGRYGALAVLTAEVELNERYGRIEPGRLPELMAAIGVKP